LLMILTPTNTLGTLVRNMVGEGNVICALTALKDVREEGGQYFSASYQPSPCEGFASRSVRAPNGTIPRRAGSRYLGVTTGCQQTLNCTCATGNFDISACLDSTPGYLNASVLDTSLTHMMRWPDDSGAGSLVDFVWLCGDHWYQILTPLWAGRCSVIYLTPSITVMTSLMHTTHHYPMYVPTSDDSVRQRRGNLTAIMISGFGELPPAIRAMRNMLMQHQMGLDLLLAAQGGLCHIIGTHCCTFIPDIEGNITDTVHHLNLLLTNLKAQDVPEQDAGWDWWAWAFEGGWKAWLARFVAPAITLLFGFLICICCVIPLIKKMISSIFMEEIILKSKINFV
uniref:Envelope protein n=1 Tax=Sander lucioperca TaxID=283035 RepID=A0A8C9ZB65_SANLU